MKRMLAIGIIMSALSAGIAISGETPAADKPAAEKTVKKQTTCPVMGGAISTNLFADVQGKRIYVCCKGCIATIKKDPATYLKKLEQDGVTPEKAPAAPGCAAGCAH